MTDALDDLYLQWIYDFVGLPKRGRNRSYWGLLSHLQSREFFWTLLNDRSRGEDGKELRWQFVQSAGVQRVPAPWLYEPCTVLEMMVAVAKRLSVQTDGHISPWFAQLLYNTRLDGYVDLNYERCTDEVEDKIDTLLWRKYRSDGEGGLFPLRHPVNDQRGVEIWYQLNAWLIEKQREEG